MEKLKLCPVCGIENIETEYYEEAWGAQVLSEHYYTCKNCTYFEKMAYSNMRKGIYFKGAKKYMDRVTALNLDILQVDIFKELMKASNKTKYSLYRYHICKDFMSKNHNTDYFDFRMDYEDMIKYLTTWYDNLRSVSEVVKEQKSNYSNNDIIEFVILGEDERNVEYFTGNVKSKYKDFLVCDYEEIDEGIRLYIIRNE